MGKQLLKVKTSNRELRHQYAKLQQRFDSVNPVVEQSDDQPGTSQAAKELDELDAILKDIAETEQAAASIQQPDDPRPKTPGIFIFLFCFS